MTAGRKGKRTDGSRERSQRRRPGDRPHPVRQAGNRPRRSRVLLVIGGRRTEKDYFDWVRGRLGRAANLTMRIEPRGGKDPETLFALAEKLWQDDLETNGSDAYDDVWVVTDVDEFAPAISRLQQQTHPRIRLVVSNPCFEVWLVLHRTTSPHPSGRQVQAQAAQLGLTEGNDGKTPRVKELAGLFEQARSGAEQLRRRHAAAGHRFPADTPSTDVDQLVTTVLSYAAEQGNEVPL